MLSPGTGLRHAVRALACAVAMGTGATLATPAFAADRDTPAPGSELTGQVGPAPGKVAPARLHLVTLDGPGVGHADTRREEDLRDLQDRTMDVIDAPSPIYRWTHALNGYAVLLTDRQADRLRAMPEVALVERNAVRALSSVGMPGLAGASSRQGSGGAGTVVGTVDTGLDPTGAAFAAVPDLGPRPRGFTGSCSEAEDWSPADCNGKVVGARYFVNGFGRDAIRTGADLSPRDDVGHGTQVASIAAGNERVSTGLRVQGHRVFSGAAPRARLAVYKACWTAPNPSGDGCATADLVSAVDAAVEDGVDVLNMSVDGPSGLDTVELALLGAAESDVVVVGSAGNNRAAEYAAHPTPWVTTVAASGSPVPRGSLRIGGRTWTGTMVADSRVGRSPVVLAQAVAAPGVAPEVARFCSPGSLDAAKAARAIVVCDRGEVSRVLKSRAVRLADGAAMVLANTGRQGTSTDLHEVPTLHLGDTQARSLRRFLDATDAHVTAELSPTGISAGRRRVPAWSPQGGPHSGIIKPNLVAPGAGVLGATTPATGSGRWGFLTGSSAAAATVAGYAAVVRAEHPTWSEARVRSALQTSARPVDRDLTPFTQGSGLPDLSSALRPGLTFDMPRSHYRRYLGGLLPASRLNLPTILAQDGHGHHHTVTRTVTNVSGRPMYYSAHAGGLGDHRAYVAPAAMTLQPGESQRFTVEFSGPTGPHPVDSGWVEWRGADDTRVRMPVALTR